MNTNSNNETASTSLKMAVFLVVFLYTLLLLQGIQSYSVYFNIVVHICRFNAMGGSMRS